MPVADVIVILAFALLAAVSVALTVIDLRTHRLPNRIVLPALAAIVGLLAVASIVRQDAPAFGRAALGAGALFAFYLALALLTRGGMGMGDVKLAALLGFAMAWVGWPALVVGALAAFVIGGLVGVALVVVRRAAGSTRIPFGPWMIVGAWLGILMGGQLWQAYSGLGGPA